MLYSSIVLELSTYYQDHIVLEISFQSRYLAAGHLVAISGHAGTVWKHTEYREENLKDSFFRYFYPTSCTFPCLRVF